MIESAMAKEARSILWFRRDLRISDHPALLAAIDAGEKIIPVFILDKSLIKTAGSKRLAYLGLSLRSLDESLGGALHVRAGQREVMDAPRTGESLVARGRGGRRIVNHMDAISCPGW